MKIAFVGYKIQEKYAQEIASDEDTALLLYLQEKELDIHAVVWNDENIVWSDYDVLVIKSPWDYHEDIQAFYDWLEKINGLNIRMLNAAEILKWNSNKHYLREIADGGLPVIPSAYLIRGAELNVELFEQFNTAKIVVKPCVSAGAKNTVVVTKENFAEKSLVVNGLLKDEDMIVQPFIAEIKNGEWSFIFFNGKYSHCVLKTPQQGEFRVQHNYGGTVDYPNPDPVYIEQAQQYVKKHAPGTLYARVDGVLIANRFTLMELEVMEPYLFLNKDRALFENYYKALISLV